MDNQWYFGLEGNVEGPLPFQQVLQLAKKQQNGMVWNPELVCWQEATDMYRQYVGRSVSDAVSSDAGFSEIHATLDGVSCEGSVNQNHDKHLQAKAEQLSTTSISNSINSKLKEELLSMNNTKSVQAANCDQINSEPDPINKTAASIAYQQYIVAKEMRNFARQLLNMEVKQAKEKQRLLRQVILEQSKRLEHAKRKLNNKSTSISNSFEKQKDLPNELSQELTKNRVVSDESSLSLSNNSQKDSNKDQGASNIESDTHVEVQSAAVKEAKSISELSDSLDDILQNALRKSIQKKDTLQKSGLRIIPNINQVVSQPSTKATFTSTDLESSDSQSTKNEYDLPQSNLNFDELESDAKRKEAANISIESNVKSSLNISKHIFSSETPTIETQKADDETSTRMLRRRRRRARY